jgi:benzoyl-CoA reductase/2-hydroxyglutaryl-CoA dehydratase subunit BcrC/BadD/HgdB
MPFHVLEVPQRKDERDFQLWLSEVRCFAEHMKKVGEPFGVQELKEAIEVVNQKREAMYRLARLRWRYPGVLSGLEGLLIEQLSFFDDPVRFSKQVNMLADELESRGERGASSSSPRIMVAGSPMPIPHWKVHAIIGNAGAVVVHEESCIGSRYYRDMVEDGGGTEEGLLEAIARRYFKITCACFTPNHERVERVVEEAVASEADGVVYHSLSFCQIYEGEARRVKRALEEKGIPTLVISTDYSTEDVEQLRTRIEAFLEEIA